MLEENVEAMMGTRGGNLSPREGFTTCLMALQERPGAETVVAEGHTLARLHMPCFLLKLHFHLGTMEMDWVWRPLGGGVTGSLCPSV